MKMTDGNTSKGTIDNNDNSETTQNITEDLLETTIETRPIETTDETKPENETANRTMTQRIIVNNRITPQLTLEFCPSHGSSKMNAFEAYLHIFNILKYIDPTLTIITR